MDSKYIYPIRYTSQRTQLTPHVIRAWEKRYQAVVPQRSAKNRRLYSEENIQRLQLLKKVTEAGHTISQVAGLDTTELIDLARQENLAGAWQPEKKFKSIRPETVKEYFKRCRNAIHNLDPNALESTYEQAVIDLTKPVLLSELIIPLFEEIGNSWRNGSLKIVNEHMATSVTRNFLVSMLRAVDTAMSAPRILVATPVGQWHDLGALVVAITAADRGWQPIYCGPNLPAEEIASGVKQSAARVVAISISHLLEQHPLGEELRKLRRYIGRELALFVGGRAVGDHLQILSEINARHITGIEQFGQELDRLLIQP